MDQLYRSLIPISVATKMLGVSLDTLRRWDKKRIIHSIRAYNKRYFLIEEIEKIKQSKPLTISEASYLLHISLSTLRRLEKKGIIKAHRSESGNRLFSRKSIECFVHSEYFLFKKRDVGEIFKNFG